MWQQNEGESEGEASGLLANPSAQTISSQPRVFFLSPPSFWPGGPDRTTISYLPRLPPTPFFCSRAPSASDHLAPLSCTMMASRTTLSKARPSCGGAPLRSSSSSHGLHRRSLLAPANCYGMGSFNPFNEDAYVGGTSTEKGAKSFGIRNSNRPPTGAVDYDFPDIFAVPPEEYFQATMTKFPQVRIFILFWMYREERKILTIINLFFFFPSLFHRTASPTCSRHDASTPSRAGTSSSTCARRRNSTTERFQEPSTYRSSRRKRGGTARRREPS